MKFDLVTMLRIQGITDEIEASEIDKIYICFTRICQM